MKKRMQQPKAIQFKCMCGGSVLALEYDPEWEYALDIAVWFRGYEDKWMSARGKLRWIWRVLKGGLPWSDQTELSPKDAREMAQWILDNVPEDHTYGL